jgi:microcystin-dependent protein
MPITEEEFTSIKTMIDSAVGEIGQTFITGKVIKRDELQKLVWIKELGDQPIPLVGVKGKVRVYDTDLPVGAMIPFGSSGLPDEFLLCDGASYTTSAYPELFAVVGYLYGGSGSNFLLPDMRGRMPVGRDAGQAEFATLGTSGGFKAITLTTPQLPAHSHGWAPGITVWCDGGFNQNFIQAGTSFTVKGVTGTANTGSDQAHNNLQPYQVANYIIKAQGSRTKVRDVVGEALVPEIGATILVALERGTRRLPRCLGEIQSTGYIKPGDD